MLRDFLWEKRAEFRFPLTLVEQVACLCQPKQLRTPHDVHAAHSLRQRMKMRKTRKGAHLGHTSCELGSSKSKCAVRDRTGQTEDWAGKATEAVVIYHYARVQSTKNKAVVGKGRVSPGSSQRAACIWTGLPGPPKTRPLGTQH